MSSISMMGRSLLSSSSSTNSGKNTEKLPNNNGTDPLARLRFAIETMPGSRKYLFTPSTRIEVLNELYTSLWGGHGSEFSEAYFGVPVGKRMDGLLSEVQGPAPETIVPGRPCGRIFKKGDSCYRCRDCAIDDSTVLCAPCFHASDHTGHNVTFYVAVQPGGLCDCGELEAWKNPPMVCSLHPPLQHTAADPSSVVSEWSALTPSRNRAQAPHELREHMSRTVAYALDFVLDTLDFSPAEIGAGGSSSSSNSTNISTNVPATETELKKVPTADPLGNDLFAIVVWNDEKHSFDEVIAHLKDSVGCSSDDAVELTNRIDSEGRAVVDISSAIPRVLSCAKQIAGIELAVTVRRAYDTFREQVSAVIIEWLCDLMQSRLHNDTVILREAVAAELYAPRKKDSSSLTSNQEATKVLSELKEPARLDWLFIYHSRLWKKLRHQLKRIIVSALSISHEHRLTVAVHFASVYHRVIDTYLLVDREAESSIKYFSVQVFTVPSVAVYIVRHNRIIQRLLDIITSFFTNNIQNKRIVHPPDPSRRVEVETYPFKSKRFMPVFSDLRYICTNRTIQELIAQQPGYLTDFIPVCQIFMGINSNKRAATSHVEYETESWISVFNVTLSLSRVVKVYGEAFAHATPANLVYAIVAVLHAILSTCTLSNDQLDKTKYSPINFHTIMFGDQEYQTIEFDVLSNWVSFHHSLHWLLAELFKHVHILDEEHLKQVEMKSLREIVLKNASERAVLTVIDFPLRVLTMVAQIRTGLWVRNGFAIRGQLLHYRDFMLRELCYDQDLFLIQCAMVILEPEIVMISILDRFQLSQWFSGDPEHTPYEGTQLFSMVEEFLFIIITCLSEFANPRHLKPLDIVRRELVHGLALGPCAFTELCKRVAERIVDDAHLDQALVLAANYKPPHGTSDYGTYELKEELYDEVNPFFFHYTRNRREDVEVILKARITKQTGEKDPVIVPKPMGIRTGPFKELPLAFGSPMLVQIIVVALVNIVDYAHTAGSMAGSADAIVDQAIHLTMLGIVELPDRFSELASTETFSSKQTTLLEVLYDLESREVFKSFKFKVRWCIEKLEKLQPGRVRPAASSPAGPSTAVDPEEAKKRAAKARQAKIMQQFAAAQKNFLSQFDDEDDDEEDESKPPSEVAETFGPCIVCQDELDSSQSFGILGFIQPSRVIKRMPEARSDLVTRDLATPVSLDRAIPPPPSAEGPRLPLSEEVAPFGVTPSEETRFGLHGSVCGHLMHTECFSIYSGSIASRHNAQPTRNHPEMVQRGEFLCPLCKSIGNMMLAVAPKLSQAPEVADLSLSEWLRKSQIELLRAETYPEPLQLPYSGEFFCWTAEDSFYTPCEAEEDDDAHHIVDTIDKIVRPLSAQTPHLRDRIDPPGNQRGKGLYMPDDFVGYTISAIEIAQRGLGDEGKNIGENVNDNTVMRLIRGLIASLAKRVDLEFSDVPGIGPRVMEHCILKRILPGGIRDREFPDVLPLLLRDPLGILIETASVAPDIYNHVLKLMYFATLARTTIGIVEMLSQLSNTEDIPEPDKRYPELFGESITIFVISVCRHSPQLETTADRVLQKCGEARIEKLLYSHTLPFLRCALLLTRALFPAPNASSPDPSLPEYHRLLHLLGVPPLAELALPQYERLRVALSSWCQHFGAHDQTSHPSTVVLDWPDVHRLARMPLALDGIFTQNSEALMCSRCETIPSDPAICLVCGTVVCHQSHCCVDVEDRKQGECNIHMRECGGAIGMYFLVKRCMVLYLYAGSGSFAQPPYLDVHGEFDYMMRRGRRQYLHNARYEDVRKMWLNHTVPTFTARKLDASMDSGGWDGA